MSDQIVYADEIAQLLGITVEELHENMVEHATFISDYQHFHQAVEAVSEDLENYENRQDRIKRLALIVTYFTADFNQFERDYFDDTIQYIYTKYSGDENANNTPRTTH